MRKQLKTDQSPEGLSERSQRLWADLVPKTGWSPGRLALLGEALRSLDRADEARALLDAEGLIAKTESTGALHIHPAVRIEKDARSQFLSAWRELGLSSTFRDANPGARG